MYQRAKGCHRVPRSQVEGLLSDSSVFPASLSSIAKNISQAVPLWIEHVGTEAHQLWHDLEDMLLQLGRPLSPDLHLRPLNPSSLSPSQCLPRKHTYSGKDRESRNTANSLA